MANNYMQMAIGLTGTLEELEWLENLITVLDTGAEEIENEAIANVYDALKEESFMGVNADLYHNGGLNGTPMLHLHSDESFNPDQLAAALQAWLGHFKIDKLITFTWANHSTRAEPDAFGGGACVVGRYSMEWLHTSIWTSQMTSARNGEFVPSGHTPQDMLSKAAHDLFHTPDTVEVEGRYTCRHCGREWRAMCGDGDVPELCPSDDCPGNIAREVLRANVHKEAIHA